MNTTVYASVDGLKGFSVVNCPTMPLARGYLMCTPEHYEVLDVKNPFMVGQAGTVDSKQARLQWERVREALEEAGARVEALEGAPGLEDMAFCASAGLPGLTLRGEKVFIPGRMSHPSRRGEVPLAEGWFRKSGYRIARLKDRAATFEGMGDALWHPGRRLLWAGHGFRTDPEVFPEIAEALQTPVALLKLVNERHFYLQTCFCPLTEDAVLVYPPALDTRSLELVLKLFPVVLTVEEQEARRTLACMTAVVGSKTAILHRGSPKAAGFLRSAGLGVVEVDVSEFLKSGGSVSCMKLDLA